jgi:PAS domain S-box-containing protein
MKISTSCCGCSRASRAEAHRETTDPPIHARSEEIEAIRQQLLTIERMLSSLFAPVFSREPQSLETRGEAADIIERHFVGIVDQWTEAVLSILEKPREADTIARIRDNVSNALIRLIDHLRDPDNLATYVYLRRHCQEGILKEAKPSEFNTIHIALKQIILNHVRSNLRGARSERVHEVVVAEIDERRLMVAQFYIESRERALRASEEKYRNSIDQSADLIYEVEPGTWRLLGVNAALENMHKSLDGHSIKEQIGKPLLDFIPPEEMAEVEKHLKTVVAKGSDKTSDWPMGPHFFDVNSALIQYGNEQFIQIVLRDVTQRREMMDQLLKAERLAATGTFAAGVAHEVNNPLASISSLAQTLLTDEDDQQRRATLHTILTQITRISSTLKDLVNFARPAVAQHRVVEVNALISETLRLVAYNKRFNGIRLEPNLTPELKPVFADDNEIQQVLLNLLFNAADALQGREGAIIKVVTGNQSTSQDDGGGRILIKVSDNGVGIPRENLERVFDPFFTTKAAGAGVGLGLSLCQRMILANHGTIRIDSEVGKGTEVTICLPAHQEAMRAETAAAW